MTDLWHCSKVGCNYAGNIATDDRCFMCNTPRETTFDATESQARKETGMALAADNAEDVLALARAAAVAIAKMNHHRECNADLVGRYLKSYHGIDSLGPAAGSIFKGDEWEFTGHRVHSARKKNHARELKVWRYVGA